MWCVEITNDYSAVIVIQTAIVMTVLSLNVLETACNKFFSVDESRALVASSSTTIAESRKVARAMLSNCNCPDEKFSPPSRTSRSLF